MESLEILDGRILITVPHMDDAVLACGGTITKLPRKDLVHIVYATDGTKSPEPPLPWRGAVPPDLGPIRIEEARAAMRCLGVSENNIQFLGLPDSDLKSHAEALGRMLRECVERIQPDWVLTPFRYDRHADHVALNRAVKEARRDGTIEAEIIEYFVYTKWKLLPAGDVRAYIRPEFLFEIDISKVAQQKREALHLFRSQTTCFYPWQTRPNLTSELLDAASRGPEVFLRAHPSVQGGAVFSHSAVWIRIAHRLEPYLKKRKDLAVSLLGRGFSRNG